MPKYERVLDRWKYLRENLYGNSEPEVTLEAITLPIGIDKYDKNTWIGVGAYGDHDSQAYIDWERIEMMPALAASTSYGSKEKIEGNYEKAISLNKRLIRMGHHMPLEVITTVWHISGIPKSASSQLRTHRLCGQVSSSKRFKSAGPAFVYPILDYIEDEQSVIRCYKTIEEHNKAALSTYEFLHEGCYLRKEDARGVLGVNYAAEKTWWCNIRELRHICNLRLRADTEIHLRKIMWMMYDTIEPLLPSLFSDISEQL